MDCLKQIRINARTHDKICCAYEKTHDEIFNRIEQDRLSAHLKMAVGFIQTDTHQKIALDYGCGSGNLTNHLIKSGLRVISSDISGEFLTAVKRKFAQSGKINLIRINGFDLSGVKDERFDFAGCYSVLHHVPDYLLLIKELIRVLKRGGVLFLDHERSESSWVRNPEYEEFLRQAKRRAKFDFAAAFRKYSRPANYIYKMRRLFDRKHTIEGDIHVWPDDHIEWGKIKALLDSSNVRTMTRIDYLLYKNYPIEIYEEYKDRLSDYSLLIARKIS